MKKKDFQENWFSPSFFSIYLFWFCMGTLTLFDDDDNDERERFFTWLRLLKNLRIFHHRDDEIFKFFFHFHFDLLLQKKT